MTLYPYRRTKDELLALLDDTIGALLDAAVAKEASCTQQRASRNDVVTNS
jgi:hypothetical protein